MRAILTYHSIDPSGSAISVAPDEFSEHVDWLRSGRVRVVPLADILAVPETEDAVAITFDDALESFGTVAAPLLIGAGLPVTVFVVSDRVGGTNRWGHPSDAAVPAFGLLGWDELRDLSDQGVELGAHTRTHPDLTRIDERRIDDEIEGSARRIEEETGRRPRSFAYPFGFNSGPSVRAARRSFDIAVTTRLDVLRGPIDPMLVPRLDMIYFRRRALLEDWAGTRFRNYVWLRRVGRRARSLALGGRS
jgi:peptidoglycan/xylan/chitin deacetylase (PgdA/CDA1 family)